MDTKVEYCNCCGKRFSVGESGQVILEDYVQISKLWGYFSRKDGIRQTMNVCEDCFTKWVSGFQISPEETRQEELL